MQSMLRQELQPLTDRFDRFEAKIESKFDRMEETYVRKDVLDQRMKPLEESAMTKNQRIGMLVSGALGLLSFLYNVIHSFVR